MSSTIFSRSSSADLSDAEICVSEIWTKRTGPFWDLTGKKDDMKNVKIKYLLTRPVKYDLEFCTRQKYQRPPKEGL
jgi:hypothetical protein